MNFEMISYDVKNHPACKIYWLKTENEGNKIKRGPMRSSILKRDLIPLNK